MTADRLGTEPEGGRGREGGEAKGGTPRGRAEGRREGRRGGALARDFIAARVEFCEGFLAVMCWLLKRHGPAVRTRFLSERFRLMDGWTDVLY